MVFFVCLFVLTAWVLGKLNFGVYCLAGLLTFSVAWWQTKNSSFQELVFTEAGLQAHRARAFQGGETVEWLNFLVNRWYVRFFELLCLTFRKLTSV